MKYVIVDIKDGDMFNEEFEDRDEAIKRLDYLWDHLTPLEQKKREAFYLLESANPDIEAEDHYDGDIIAYYKK